MRFFLIALMIPGLLFSQGVANHFPVNRLGLVGWFSSRNGGEISAAGNWKGYSGLGYSAALSGDSFVTSSLVLDGTGDYGTTTDSGPVLDITQGDYTILLWAYFESFTSKPLLVAKGAYNASGYYMRVSTTGGSLQAVHNVVGANDYTQSVDGVLQVMKWEFIAFSRSGTDVRIYINAVQQSESVAESMRDAVEGDEDFKIGVSSGGGALLDGKVDGIMFFNRQLTDEEISANYNKQRGFYP